MKTTRIFALLATVCLLISAALAQNPSTYGTNAGRYGMTAWAVNGQRVASQFNYYIDSTYQSAVGGVFNFAIGTCTQALPLGGNKNVNPFATNASVRIIDVNSSASETVNGVAPVYSGSICSLPFTTAQTHTAGSFILRSGTCGLREALNDLGGQGGTVIVDQKFYDDGCSASTITGLTLTAGAGLVASQYIHDISGGQDTWFQLRGTSLTLTAAPTALTTASTLLTATTGGTIATGQAIRAGITCVDAIGRETPLSTDSAGTAVVTTGAGSTNSITVVAPGAAGCPNSVAYRTYLTANSGATLTEILYAPSSSTTVGNQCVASANSIIVNACALTSNSVIVSIITGTAGIPLSGVVSGGSGATLVGYLDTNLHPQIPGFQIVYGPYPAITSVTTVQNAAEVVIPAGFFNDLGEGFQVCLAGVGTPAAATLVGTFKLTLGPRQATGVQTIDNIPFSASGTWNPAAASNWTYCTNFVTSAVGTSGTIEAHSMTGFITSATAGAVPPAFGPQLDTTTAPSTALDITQQLYLDVLLTASVSSFTTFTVREVTITPIN